MKKVTVTCDRCGSSVEGMEEPGVATSAFYGGPAWAQYMNEDETKICDDCMQSDKRYRNVYGPKEASQC